MMKSPKNTHTSFKPSPIGPIPKDWDLMKLGGDKNIKPNGGKES